MGFSITDVLMPTSKAAAPTPEYAIERISYYDLIPSEDNFYSMAEIEELKTAIELAGRVMDNLVVTPLPDGKYKILSGHRRHAAVGMLLDEGKTEYEWLPCLVEQITDTDRPVREQVLLIAANSQREKTAWDKLEEVRHMRDLQRKAKAEQGLNGRVRDLVAQSLHISASRVAKYDSILNNLSAPLMEEIKADRLPIYIAYALSKMNADQQQAAYDHFAATGKLPSEGDLPQTTVKPDAPAPHSEKPSEHFSAPQTDEVQPEPLPGDVARLTQQLIRLSQSDNKLKRLAKLLDTNSAQLAADLDALNDLSL